MYVHGMRYLTWLDGYNRSWLLEDLGIFFVMCSQVSRLSFTCDISFKGTPLDWGLANVFEDLDFLLHNYWEQNKQTNKPRDHFTRCLTARVITVFNYKVAGYVLRMCLFFDLIYSFFWEVCLCFLRTFWFSRYKRFWEKSGLARLKVWERVLGSALDFELIC